MACVWYGVQAWIGGSCVSLMIRESYLLSTLSEVTG
jgi:cytosine/uracil/thiamine/allantoin permease